ncbi:hypothetical protein ONZ45_g8140 [Pleurotus djamor]|nr:hypothetical protein ONZ45_g8140 [Pleurotus djamor]
MTTVSAVRDVYNYGVWDRRPTRLFDTQTKAFATVDTTQEQYAILSHRWGEKEMSFTDLSNGSLNSKFENFCDIASEQYGIRFVWIDSGCINQKDQQELDASIQSMYWWYLNSSICIVYLSDVAPGENITESEWFTRGWTLQELLAPRRMEFYYKDWTRLTELPAGITRCYRSWFWEQGGRDRRSDEEKLKKSIAEAAGIEIHFLDTFFHPHPGHLPEVLKWAKNRMTTKEEDRVYSLVSLLNVFLPSNYDEGYNNALERLKCACLSPSPSSIDTETLKTYSQLEVTTIFRDQSSFCEDHRTASGFPIIVELKGDGVNAKYPKKTSKKASKKASKASKKTSKNATLPSRYLLFTTALLPTDDQTMIKTYSVFKNPDTVELTNEDEKLTAPLLLIQGDWTKDVTIVPNCSLPVPYKRGWYELGASIDPPVDAVFDSVCVKKLVFSPTLPQEVLRDNEDPTLLSTSHDTPLTTNTVNVANDSPNAFLPSTLDTALHTDTVVAATTTIVRLGTLETGTQTQVMMQALESRDKVIVGLAVSMSILAGFLVGYLLHRLRGKMSRKKQTTKELKTTAESDPIANVADEVPSPPWEPESVNPTRLESEPLPTPAVSPNPPPSVARSSVRWDFLNDDPFDDTRRASRTSSLPSYRSEDPDQTSSARMGRSI